jgi:hypothetical protein
MKYTVLTLTFACTIAHIATLVGNEQKHFNRMNVFSGHVRLLNLLSAKNPRMTWLKFVTGQLGNVWYKTFDPKDAIQRVLLYKLHQKRSFLPLLLAE